MILITDVAKDQDVNNVSGKLDWNSSITTINYLNIAFKYAK